MKIYQMLLNELDQIKLSKFIKIQPNVFRSLKSLQIMQNQKQNIKMLSNLKS